MNARLTRPFSARRTAMAVLLALSCHAASAAEGDKLFKAQCAACHGANGAGNAALQAPPLAGTDKEYVVRQLRNFRSRARGGAAPQGAAAAMQAVALSLPDDSAVLALAGYIATLKPAATTGAKLLPGPALTGGKAIFGGCVACHGSLGEGNPALAAPRLTHLPTWYLTAQLQAYREGQRGTHVGDLPGQQMRQIATEALPDDDAVNAVVAYVVSLGGRAR